MRKAFTLIELIATIVILGVVTSIVSILIMNIIRNVKDSANKRSIDNYGRIADTAMSEYQSQYLKYPTSFNELNIEYTGSKVECKISRINPDNTIYLSECEVNGKKVLDKNTEDGYYHYGTLLLTNEEYVDKLGNNIELALKDYYKENNKYPVNYRLLNIPKLDKDVNCVSHINPDGTVYLTKCSIDGSYILNENEEDGYYHYGKTIYDYFDKDGNGYNKVAYIQSAGAQYIDTGFKPNQDTRIQAHIYRDKYINSFQFPFGARTSAGSNEFEMAFYQAGGGWRDDYGNTDNRIILGYTEATGDFYIDKNKNVTTINNVSVTHNLVDFQSDYNLIIFGTNYNIGFQSGESDLIKLYYFQIYDNEVLIRDYVPVVDSKKNGCLFDKVNRKCYYDETNHGFGYHNEAEYNSSEYDSYKDNNNHVYRHINYLESTGTQYIDTGFKPNQDTRIQTHIYRNKYVKSFQFPFGARTSAGSNEFEMVFYQSGGGWRDDYGNTDNRGFLGYTEATGDFYINKNKSVTTINDISIVHNLSSFQSDYNLIIFGTNYNIGFQSGESDLIKLYSFRVYDNGDVVRDYIPVIDSTERPCLFDKVSKECYYNQGTGEFLYG